MERQKDKSQRDFLEKFAKCPEFLLTFRQAGRIAV